MTGRIFKKKFKRPNGSWYEGKIWWISYMHRGKEHKESSESERKSDAKRLLEKRLGEIGTGRFIGRDETKVTFEQMAEDFIRDYEINDKRSVGSARLSVSHLRSFFGMDKALNITTDRVRAYVSYRQNSKDRRGNRPKNGTINRELSALKRMFTLAREAEKISSTPVIKLLEENNARQGFLEHGEFVSLTKALPEYLKDPVSFLYYSGWRVSEMRALEWRDVDLTGGVVRLRPEVSKNKDGRLLPLTGELKEIICRASAVRRLECRFVFHKNGQPIGDFKKAWYTARTAAGLHRLLVHDLRRTAVRNLSRAGVPDPVAMKLSGHKTRSVYDRYNVTNEKDLAQAADQLDSYLRRQSTVSMVRPMRAAVNATEQVSDTIRTQGGSANRSVVSKSAKNMEPPAGVEPATY